MPRFLLSGGGVQPPAWLPVTRSPASRTFMSLCLPTPALNFVLFPFPPQKRRVNEFDWRITNIENVLVLDRKER